MPNTKLIRISAAAKMLGCSRNTMKAIATANRLRKVRLTDGPTSPYYLVLSEVRELETKRMELSR